MIEHKILDYLKENGRTAKSKVSKSLKIHYYKIDDIISKMENKGLIEIDKSKTRVYIELKGGRNNE